MNLEYTGRVVCFYSTHKDDVTCYATRILTTIRCILRLSESELNEKT
jgi:hypothetical protein